MSPKKIPKPPPEGSSQIRELGVRVWRDENTTDYHWSTRYGFGVADTEERAYYNAGAFDRQAWIKRELVGLLGRFPQ